MIVFVTAREWPDMGPDDAHLIQAMNRQHVAFTTSSWDDPETEWHTFDAVVIRSPWDYYQRPDAFRSWINARAGDGSNLWNPADALSWNMDKRYLGELEEAGVAVVETEWMHGDGAGVADVMRRRGWSRAVAKPIVSAGAWRTSVITHDDLDAGERHLAELLASGGAMVQPFLDQIVDEGEWSLVFFGGRFSHALVKRPAAGDFRVQERHGGSVAGAEAPAGLRADAERVLEAFGRDALYARVDGVRAKDRLVLIELEVLEPVLYFGTARRSADRYVEELLRRMR